MPAVTGVPSAFCSWPTTGICVTVMTAAAPTPVGVCRPRLTLGPSSVASMMLDPAPIEMFACCRVGWPPATGGMKVEASAPGSVRLAGVTFSVMRSTRRPGDRSPAPSPPDTPAAVAACESGSFSALMTRSTSGVALAALAVTSAARATAAIAVALSSGLSWTMPFWVVRITSPLWTRSPSLSRCILPSVPRMWAVPQIPVTLPWNVWTMVGMEWPCDSKKANAEG